MGRPTLARGGAGGRGGLGTLVKGKFTVIDSSLPHFSGNSTHQVDDLHLGQRMRERLNRAPHGVTLWTYLSRPTAGGGYEQDWMPADKLRNPRPAWLEHEHVLFLIHPHTHIPKTNAHGEARPQHQVRGSGDDTAVVNCLFVEIDAIDTIEQAEWLPYYLTPDVSGMTPQQARGALQKAETAAKNAALVQDLPEYKRRSLAKILGAPVKPSACWDSGGGYQAIWLLDETVILTDENRADVARVQKAFVALVGGDPAASDLNRVLRMPGTVNRKPKYGPNGHPVRYLWCDLERSYSWAELAALVPPGEAHKPTRARRVYVPAGLPAELGDFADVPRLPQHEAVKQFNAANDLRDMLLAYGYTDAGTGRMNRPGGDTAGVQLHPDNTASIFSSADPLYCGHRITPAHVTAVFEYAGDANRLMTALTGLQWPPPDLTPERIDAMLAWARGPAGREFLCDAGIRRPDGYLRTLEAMIRHAAKKRGWASRVGVRDLALACNASHSSVETHLRTLNGTLWQLWPTEYGYVIDLAMGGYAILATSLDSPANTGKDSVGLQNGGGGKDSVAPPSRHFLDATLKEDAFVPVAYTHGIRRRVAPTVLLPSLGHQARLLWAALLDADGLDRADLAAVTGISPRTVEKTMRLLERLHLVDVVEDAFGTKSYTLASDAHATLERLRPEMTSHMTHTRRQEQSCAERIVWLKREEAKSRVAEHVAELQKRQRGLLGMQLVLRLKLEDAGIRPAKGWTPPDCRRPWEGAHTGPNRQLLVEEAAELRGKLDQEAERQARERLVADVLAYQAAAQTSPDLVQQAMLATAAVYA
jgi:DNA-binding transcriptional ArsR family regulator